MIDCAYRVSYNVDSRDFSKSGEASRAIKKALHQMGIDTPIIRRVSIATYEAEMNLAIHSLGGEVIFSIDNQMIIIEAKDIGPGIGNVEQAMLEGYSTATSEIREMGFGAGMGLSNMKSCADVFHIESQVDIGTQIRMIFNLEEKL